MHARKREPRAMSPGRRSASVSPDIPGARPFGRWLLVETDPLPLIQCLEGACLHRTAMEEPLLTAVVPDEPKTAIAHQPLDRPVSHVDNLRGPCLHDPGRV